MTSTGALVVSVVLAVLIVAALAKPTRQLVGGLVYRDKQGRLVLILTPVPKGKRKRRRR